MSREKKEKKRITPSRVARAYNNISLNAINKEWVAQGGCSVCPITAILIDDGIITNYDISYASARKIQDAAFSLWGNNYIKGFVDGVDEKTIDSKAIGNKMKDYVNGYNDGKNVIDELNDMFCIQHPVRRSNDEEHVVNKRDNI